MDGSDVPPNSNSLQNRWTRGQVFDFQRRLRVVYTLARFAEIYEKEKRKVGTATQAETGCVTKKGTSRSGKTVTD